MNSVNLFYILPIPLVFAIFVISIVLIGLCCCCCKKVKKRGDPKPKTPDLEAGATSLSPTESSGGLNAMTSPDERQPMLLCSHGVSVSHTHTQSQTHKSSSSPKKSVGRMESQTEHLLQDEHKQYGETGDSIRSTDFATPNPFSPQSAEIEVDDEISRHSTYSGTIKPTLYPQLPNSIPRSNTLPNKLRPPETYQTYAQPESPTKENIADSPQTDNSMAPLYNPIIVNDGGSYSFTQKQSLDDLSRSRDINISIVSSIKSVGVRKLSEVLDVTDLRWT